MKYFALVAVMLSVGCGGEVLPSAKYVRGLDCAYHVLDDVFKHDDDLIDRVLSVAQGPLQIEEFVETLVQLHKHDDEIIEGGKRLRACIPEELLE